MQRAENAMQPDTIISSTSTPKWTPRYVLRANQIRTIWPGVLLGSRWTGDPGITHLSTAEGLHVLEYRDADGLLRGVVKLEPTGALFLMTDPAYRKRGICTALLAEAIRLDIPIDFRRQSYTRAGWRAVRRFARREVRRG